MAVVGAVGEIAAWPPFARLGVLAVADDAVGGLVAHEERAREPFLRSPGAEIRHARREDVVGPVDVARPGRARPVVDARPEDDHEVVSADGDVRVVESHSIRRSRLEDVPAELPFHRRLRAPERQAVRLRPGRGRVARHVGDSRPPATARRVEDEAEGTRRAGEVRRPAHSAGRFVRRIAEQHRQRLRRTAVRAGHVRGQHNRLGVEPHGGAVGGHPHHAAGHKTRLMEFVSQIRVNLRKRPLPFPDRIRAVDSLRRGQGPDHAGNGERRIPWLLQRRCGLSIEVPPGGTSVERAQSPCAIPLRFEGDRAESAGDVRVVPEQGHRAQGGLAAAARPRLPRVNRLPENRLVVLALATRKVRRRVERRPVDVRHDRRHSPRMCGRMRHDRANGRCRRVGQPGRIRRYGKPVRRQRPQMVKVVLRQRRLVDAQLVEEHRVRVRCGQERPLGVGVIVDRATCLRAHAILHAVNPQFEDVLAPHHGELVPGTVRKRRRPRHRRAVRQSHRQVAGRRYRHRHLRIDHQRLRTREHLRETGEEHDGEIAGLRHEFGRSERAVRAGRAPEALADGAAHTGRETAREGGTARRMDKA